MKCKFSNECINYSEMCEGAPEMNCVKQLKENAAWYRRRAETCLKKSNELIKLAEEILEEVI